MPKITLKQMVRQWTGATRKFEVNVSNAAAQLAMFAVDTFKKSFDLKRFNSQGSAPWPALKNKAKPTHIALLKETGALKESITATFYYMLGQGALIEVRTDPKFFVREHRNNSGRCYASIHNSGGNKEATPGSRASFIAQRQFMPTEESGDSSYMIDMYNTLHMKIFYNLPK